jgi:hypothetical protein
MVPTLSELGFAHVGDIALAKTESKATDVNLTEIKNDQTAPGQDEEIDTIPYVKSEP